MKSKWMFEELNHIDELWDIRPRKRMDHSKNAWNERAHDWEKDLKDNNQRKDRSEKRVKATLDYLLDKGVIDSETTLIDIGCGPGRFVCEFAKVAKEAHGLDLSDAMTSYGQKFCEKQGILNTSFIVADFKNMNIEAEGLNNRYDLVFSSITPAIGYKEGYKKAMQMSKKWFFNACFVDTSDSITTELERELSMTGERFGSDSGFYCMFNDLFLNGYFPEVTYYEETEEDVLGFEKAARKYTRAFFGIDYKEEEYQKISLILNKYVDEEGNIRTNRKLLYAWTLVDKNMKRMD